MRLRYRSGIKTLQGKDIRANILRNSAGSFILGVAFLVLSLVANILLGRSLGPEGYGIYAFALALVSLLAIPSQIGLPTLLVRNVAAYQARDEWGLLRGMLYRANQMVLVISLMLVAIAGTLVWVFADHLKPEQLSTFASALVLLPVVALGNLRGAALRGLRLVVLGQLPEQLLRPGLLVVFILAVSFFGDSHLLTPPRAMTLHVIAALVAFAVGAGLLLRAIPEPAKVVPAQYQTRAWVRSVLPLSFLAAMQVINQQIGILMLGACADSADVGVYRAAGQGGTLVAFGLTAVNMALSPNISRLYVQGDREGLQRVVTFSSRMVLLTALPVAGAFIIFGAFFLSVAFGPEYTRGHIALAILALGQLVNAAMGSVGILLNMTGHERDTAAGVTVAAVANVLLNFLLVPSFGIEGAAIAAGTSLTIWNLLLVYRVNQRLGIVSTAVPLPFLTRKTVAKGSGL